MKEYDVVLAPRVVEQIRSIKDYIAKVKLSPDTAEKLANVIFEEIIHLSAFPERGFNADEKVGVKIDKNGRDSRGIAIQNGQYIVIYSIDEEMSRVDVAYLISTKTDYAKLFL